MIRGGTDIAVAMRISGHQTRSTFDRYNIVSTEDLRAAVNRTASYVASLPVERNVVAMTPTTGNERGQNTDSGSSTASSGLLGSGTYGPAMAEAGGNRIRQGGSPGIVRYEAVGPSGPHRPLKRRPITSEHGPDTDHFCMS
jgi:hypothetical protein